MFELCVTISLKKYVIKFWNKVSEQKRKTLAYYPQDSGIPSSSPPTSPPAPPRPSPTPAEAPARW